jgi:hypothetical protein
VHHTLGLSIYAVGGSFHAQLETKLFFFSSHFAQRVVAYPWLPVVALRLERHFYRFCLASDAGKWFFIQYCAPGAHSHCQAQNFYCKASDLLSEKGGGNTGALTFSNAQIV